MITHWRPIPRGRRTKDAPRRTSAPRASCTHARARTHTHACTKTPSVLKNSRKIATKSHTCGPRIPRDRACSGPTAARARAGTRVSAPHALVDSPPRCGNRRARVAPSNAAPTHRRPRRRRVRARNAVRHYVRDGVVTLGLRRIDRAGVGPTSEATHWALRNSDRGGRAPTKFNASFAVGAGCCLSGCKTRSGVLKVNVWRRFLRGCRVGRARGATR